MISLAMICRDNEDTIEAALKSVQPWVDEMVVVDTGSTDSTRMTAFDIADDLYSIQWNDDFSHARNKSINHCHEPWIFWMDSDEYLPPESGKRLREVVDYVPDDVGGITMLLKEPGQVLERLAVFRNDPRIRFSGRIHEQVAQSVLDAGYRIHRTDIVVEHHQDKSKRAAKDKRNLDLLVLDLKERPHNSFSLFNLGMTYIGQMQYRDAVHYLLQSKDCAEPNESHLPKLYSSTVLAHIQAGNIDAAVSSADDAVRRFPGDSECWFYWALSRIKTGQWQEAIDGSKKCRALKPSQFMGDPEMHVKALQNMAGCYEQIGDLASALMCCENAVVESDGAYRPIWPYLIRLAIALGHARGRKATEDARNAELAGVQG